jgi:hypothetical protein
MNIFRAVTSAEVYTLLQSDIERIEDWCAANFMN